MVPEVVGRRSAVRRTDLARRLVRVVHDQAFPRKIPVPAGLRPVFVDEILPVHIGEGPVGHIPVNGGNLIGARFPELQVVFLFQPAQVNPLFKIEIRRSPPLVVVGAAAHRGIGIQAAGLAVGFVIDIIHIRQAHRVAELVARGTDPAHLPPEGAVADHLVGTSIVVDDLPVQAEGIACVTEFPLVRPDGVVVAGIRLAVARIIHKHQVHLSVAVIVIPAEIDLFVQFLTSADDGLLGTDVVPPPVVGAIVRLRRVHPHRTVHVEHRLEHAVRIVIVEIPGGTGSAVDRVTRLVQQGGESRLGILRGREREILEFHKDDQEMLLSDGHVAVGAGGTGSTGLPGRTAAGGGIEPDRRGGSVVGYGTEEAVLVLFHHAAHRIGRPVAEFVPVALDDDFRTIRLKIDHLAGTGRNGVQQQHSGEKHGQCKKYTLTHIRYFLRMIPWPEPFPSQTFGPDS